MNIPNQSQSVERRRQISFLKNGQVHPQQFNIRAIEPEEPEMVPLSTTTCWYRRNGTVRRCQTISS